ncbi:retrotransposable element Tf2 [Tanacetum coccineum]
MREEMEKLMAEMRNAAIEATASGSRAMVRPQADRERGMQYHKVTKIKFPRFGGEDVRGWLFKCEQFFKVDDVADDQKVNLVSIHLHDIALMWHRQFVRLMELSEEQSISFFLVGLQQDVEIAVRMFKPRSLTELYGLDKLQETNLNAMESKNRMPLLPNSRYVPGHKCPGQMFSLEVVADNDEEEIVWNSVNEDGDCELSDVINAVQEENNVPHISLNALYGRNTFHTMRVSGYVGKHEIHILKDSGSTHNFLDCNTTKKLGCPLTSTYHLQVIVANGNNMMTSKMCRMKWSLHGEDFVADMMILPLGGCEMVLGIQWLSTLGNIICNFRDLKMSFQYNGKTINFTGSQKGVIQWMQGKQLAKNMGIQGQLSSMILCVYPESVLIPKELPPVRSHDHRILLKEGAPTLNIRPYRHPATQKDAIESMVQELLDVGVIRHS